MKKKRKIKFDIIFTICIILIMLLFFGVIIFRDKIKNNNLDTFQVDIDKYQISSDAKGYILLNENIIDYDKNQTIIPISEKNKRVSKDSIVAIYKNSDYEDKINLLKEIDNEINFKLSKLPYVYSKEVNRLEEDINSLIKANRKEMSYIEMINFKAILDDLTYKKAMAKSKQSPSGEEIITLLKERNIYLEDIKSNVNNSVKTSVAGILSYNIDGLESNYIDNLKNIDLNEIDKIINKYDNINNSSFGIKIINNYEAYILFKINNNLNDNYAILNRNYNLKIINQNKNIKALLVSKYNKDSSYYYIFKINNNIEDLLEYRKFDFKIIWKSLNGFAINKNLLKYKKNGNEIIPYVEILSMNEKIDVFVKKVIEFEDIYIVQNYTNDERKNLGIVNERKLLRYDRILN